MSKLIAFSTKSALGHILAAAPVVDTIVASQILKSGLVPPPSSSQECGKESDFSGPIEVSSGRVLVNCRTWEGHCDSLVVETVA